MMNLLRFAVLLICLSVNHAAFGQLTLVKDLDGDLLNDTVSLDRSRGVLLCRLSTLGFPMQKSKVIADLGSSCGLEAAKNGFKFFNYQMREGYTCQFRFNPKVRKMELIGMSRYHDGNANLDGSGESSVNLLTNIYLGNWSYFEQKGKRLRKTGLIKQRMVIPQTFLEGFSDAQPGLYRQECDQISRKQASHLRR
ncbi:hypothetical protein [Pedobacter sp. MC2016-24]|uniref:hypothetical protein n=1 Tax=Pedobacter sp. MC2016-24 TaxID=2780090 RepID=UPI00187FDC04|nr:hypothetical protein [Pedobacter sp. MC2016-24]MBE9597778.1 hypothetical protein [Pedobacter sp. MC2016-24]